MLNSKGIILQILASLMVITFSYSQNENDDSLVQDNQIENKIEKDKTSLAEQQLFIEKYEIGSMKGIRSKMLDKFEMRTEPSCESEKTGILVPKDSIVYAYKYFNDQRCWAIKYKNDWGFVKDHLVFPVFEDKNEKKASKFDEPPQLKTQIKPKYPAEAKKKGIKGKVFIKVFIDEKGIAQDAIILRGVDELNQAAIDAVKKAKYKPAKYEGKPVGVWVNLSIKF